MNTGRNLREFDKAGDQRRKISMPNEMKISRILVTGGAGFLGASLVPLLLERGYEVVVIDDFSNGKESHLARVKDHPKLKIHRGDILIRSDVERACVGCDAVIHLAVLCLRQSIRDDRGDRERHSQLPSGRAGKAGEVVPQLFLLGGLGNRPSRSHG
jgi:uncharacterized protein YbjT (DUF2867 family)